jgi:hypothetical protein
MHKCHSMFTTSDFCDCMKARYYVCQYLWIDNSKSLQSWRRRNNLWFFHENSTFSGSGAGIIKHPDRVIKRSGFQSSQSFWMCRWSIVHHENEHQMRVSPHLSLSNQSCLWEHMRCATNPLASRCLDSADWLSFHHLIMLTRSIHIPLKKSWAFWTLKFPVCFFHLVTSKWVIPSPRDN